MRAAVRLLLAVLTAASSAQSLAQPKSDWELADEERNWQEREVALPAYPKPEQLLEFHFSAATDFRFFIDSSSLSVDPDGVVRYTLVARSPSGAENVSYEGIRCRSRMVKAYAFGQGGGRWSARGTAWRPIERRGPQDLHFALWREYFCPHAIAIANAAEGLEALRRGANALLADPQGR